MRWTSEGHKPTKQGWRSPHQAYACREWELIWHWVWSLWWRIWVSGRKGRLTYVSRGSLPATYILQLSDATAASNAAGHFRYQIHGLWMPFILNKWHFPLGKHTTRGKSSNSVFRDGMAQICCGSTVSWQSHQTRGVRRMEKRTDANRESQIQALGLLSRDQKCSKRCSFQMRLLQYWKVPLTSKCSPNIILGKDSPENGKLHGDSKVKSYSPWCRQSYYLLKTHAGQRLISTWKLRWSFVH